MLYSAVKHVHEMIFIVNMPKKDKNCHINISQTIVKITTSATKKMVKTCTGNNTFFTLNMLNLCSNVLNSKNLCSNVHSKNSETFIAVWQ